MKTENPGGPAEGRPAAHGAAPNASESGFAMLFVFLLAAFVAISLYMETPRVIFEAQRNREQLLIDRGEQYKRAIQVYFRRYRRYPPNLDALENTDNRHFLRQRYKDPMTGQEEWRLIHIAGPGIFADSLVMKPPAQGIGSGGSTSGLLGQTDSSTTTTGAAETPATPWTQRRPSDMTLPAAEGGLALPGGTQPDSGTATSLGQPQTTAGYPQPAPGLFFPGQPTGAGQPPGTAPSAQPGQPPGTVIQPIFPGMPTPPGGPGSPQIPGQSPTGQPVMVPGLGGPFGQSPGQMPGSQPNSGMGQPAPGGGPGITGRNPALDLIGQMLTRPNPQGMSAIPTAPGTGQQFGGGVAGVASKLEAEGIKVYNDRTKYNEWEFLYDYRLDRQAAGFVPASNAGSQTLPGTGAPGVPVQPPAGMGGPVAPGQGPGTVGPGGLPPGSFGIPPRPQAPFGPAPGR